MRNTMAGLLHKQWPTFVPIVLQDNGPRLSPIVWQDNGPQPPPIALRDNGPPLPLIVLRDNGWSSTPIGCPDNEFQSIIIVCSDHESILQFIVFETPSRPFPTPFAPSVPDGCRNGLLIVFSDSLFSIKNKWLLQRPTLGPISDQPCISGGRFLPNRRHLCAFHILFPLRMVLSSFLKL
jgi:hypothetical protein